MGNTGIVRQLVIFLLLLLPMMQATAVDTQIQQQESGQQQDTGDLIKMLKRMSEADASNIYVGTFVLYKSGKLSSLRVTHGKDEHGAWEEIESLNGEPRKVLRQNNKVISVSPARALVTIRHTDNPESLHYKLPDNIEQLAQFYAMKKLDDDRIANRPAMVVDLVPNDHYRYGYRYWIDKDTGMLLRCDLKDENDNVVEHMMFTSLTYLNQSPSFDAELEKLGKYKEEVVDEPSQNITPASSVPWQVKNPPEGFMLTQSMMHYASHPDAGQASENAKPDLLHLVYSDGLASVSVFIESNPDDPRHLVGPATMGVVNAYGQASQNYFVTVVGEVPEKTVKRMAQSLVKIEH